MVATVGEKEDTVVREIEVFLSSSSTTEYHLLQYPGHFVNPIPQPPLSVRMKPRHHILEAEHAVHAGNHTRLYQGQTIPINTHLCFGRVVVDEASSKVSMHLIPISQISQMRPTFHHLFNHDEEDEEFDDTDRMDGSREYRTRQESITEDLSPVPSATNITFHRKESDRAVAARKSSYAYQHASQENEPWVSLDVVEKMTVLPHVSSNPSVFTPQSSYIQTLSYIPSKNGHTGSSHATSTTAYNDVSLNRNSHVVAQKLLRVLQPGGPIPLSILLLAMQDSALNTLSSANEMIVVEPPWDVLNVMAVVVRGNWYLHSKYLQASRNTPPDHGLIQRPRTFLLLLLQEFGQIHRSSLQKVIDRMKQPLLSSDRILCLLRQVAEPPSSTRYHWVPKMADDLTFVQKYPSVARLHDAYWKKQRLRFSEELRVYSANL